MSQSHQATDDDFDERERAASAAPPVPDVKRILTRDEALAARRAEEEGFEFRLFRTGGIAVVRLVSLADRASLKALPNGLQQRMIEIISKVGGGGRKAGELPTKAEFFREVDNNLELADLFCLAGFIKPRLVLREQDLDSDPYTWLVSDLHPDERVAFVKMMDDEGATQKMAPFLRGPNPDVLDQRTLEAPAPPQRTAGDEWGRS